MSSISFMVNAILTSKSKDIEGTTLATLTALMKAIKMNSSKPVAFLLRERLQDRRERRELNVVLNAIASGLHKAKSARIRTAKSGRNPGLRTKAQPAKPATSTPKVKTVRVDGAVASPMPLQTVATVPSQVQPVLLRLGDFYIPASQAIPSSDNESDPKVRN
jgi:hypothetical protein